MRPDFRQAIMPYGMNKNPDGSWTFFNRNYKTAGTITEEWSDWDDARHKLFLVGLDRGTLRNLDIEGKGEGDTIYFYDDATNPAQGRAQVDRYLRKLQILMELSPEE